MRELWLNKRVPLALCGKQR